MTINALVARMFFRNPVSFQRKGRAPACPVAACRRWREFVAKRTHRPGPTTRLQRINLITNPSYGRECGVGRGLGVALGGGVGDIGGELGVGVAVGGGVCVAVGVGVTGGTVA